MNKAEHSKPRGEKKHPSFWKRLDPNSKLLAALFGGLYGVLAVCGLAALDTDILKPAGVAAYSSIVLVSTFALLILWPSKRALANDGQLSPADKDLTKKRLVIFAVIFAVISLLAAAFAVRGGVNWSLLAVIFLSWLVIFSVGLRSEIGFFLRDDAS